MRKGAVLNLHADRGNPAAWGFVQTRLPTYAKAIKRRFVQTGWIENDETTQRASDQTRKRFNAQARLWNAGSGLQTGLPANTKTLQREYDQPLKQG
jgi:hypothetical protein